MPAGLIEINNQIIINNQLLELAGKKALSLWCFAVHSLRQAYIRDGHSIVAAAAFAAQGALPTGR